MELILGGAGDLSMKVKANLTGKTGEIHGSTERVGGWSESVLGSVRELVNALESHLLAVNFDVGEEDDRSAELSAPAGILGSRLGSP